MRANVQTGELRFLRNRSLDTEATSDGVSCVVEDEHERVTDLFDDPATGPVGPGSHYVLEAIHDLSGHCVTHRQRQGREVDEVDEHHGAEELAADFSRSGYVLHQVQEHVLQ